MTEPGSEPSRTTTAPPADSGAAGNAAGAMRWGRIAERFGELARAQAHAELCRLGLACAPDSMPPWAIGQVLLSGLEARDEGAITWAVDRLGEIRPPRPLRARLAWGLAHHRRAADAVAMLKADPAVLDASECRGAVLRTLGRVMMSALAPHDARAWASAEFRRLSGVQDGGFHETPFRFRRQAPCPSLAPRGGIGCAPGIEAGSSERVRDMLEAQAAQSGKPEPVARVIRYESVYVNAWGAIWRADGTVHRNPFPGAATVPLREVPGAPVHAAGVLAAGNTNNLFHWLGGVLRGLAWRFDSGAPAIPIVLRDDGAPYQRASLALLGGEAVPVIGVGEAAFFRELYVQDWAGLGVHEGGSSRFLYERMIAAAGPPAAEEMGRRIFISRRDARLRRPDDEAALEQVFERHGFEIVALTPMPLARRIRMLQGASMVAGIHGAGMSMVFAARPGTPVYEILPWMPNTLPTRLCMAALSGAFGLRHRLWIEPCDEVGERWRPHLGEIERDLAAFIARESA